MLRRVLPLLLAGGISAACLDDPVGPGALRVVSDLSTDSLIAGHPGEALPQAVRIHAVTSAGTPIRAARVEWTPSGTGSHIQEVSNETDAHGYASAGWVLGTQARDSQTLDVQVSTSSHTARAKFRAIAVPYVVTRVHLLPGGADTVRLSDTVRCVLQAEDPFGNRFPAPRPSFVSTDTTLFRVDTLGGIRVLRRGAGLIVGSVAGVADTMRLSAIQVVQRIVTSVDAFRFHAIGQVASDSVKLIDDRSLEVKDSVPQVQVADTSVARLVQVHPIVLRSSANGTTSLRLQAGTVVKDLGVAVAQQASSVELTPASITFDALNDTARVTAVVRDSLGVPLVGPPLTYSSSDSATVVVGGDGLIRSKRNGIAWVTAHTGAYSADSVRVTVAQQVASFVVQPDSFLFEALNAVGMVRTGLHDRLGFSLLDVAPSYRVRDTAVATVGADGTIRARGNGSTWLVMHAGADSALVGIRVAQRPVRLVVPTDTIRLTAIGDTALIPGTPVDSLGSPVTGSVALGSISDTTIVGALGQTAIQARSAGTAVVVFTAAGLSGQVVATVSPTPASIQAGLVSQGAIASVSLDSLMPLTCRVRDRNGNIIDTMPRVVSSSAGRWAGGNCGALRARRSGFDTVRVQAGGLEAQVPIVLAVRAIVSSPMGNFLQFDTLPTASSPWAPTVRRNSRGEFEVYLAAWIEAIPGEIRSDLHRFVSSDGITFRYDGVVLQHDQDLCSPQGSGIENVNIVPRADGPGWRMFFSAGSFVCYGWQVFSAVSTDERTWVKEPGVRITNGGTLPPDASVSPPWPSGEGMVTEQLPSGEWRMIVGAYEHLVPRENKFQIIEWRSPDQVNWSYVGPILTTRDMPAGGQGTIYSPTIRQIAPGLWRMIFSGDDRFLPGWRGRIWSAVSTDEHSWQVEGELMGGEQTRLWYVSLADDRLVFMREDTGDQKRLAIATVLMP